MRVFKRKIFLAMGLIAIFLFNGCENSNENFEDKDSKELLNKRVFYYVDTIGEEYKKYSFEDNTLVEYTYDNKVMNNLKSKKQYTLYYDKDDKLTILTGEDTKDCNVMSCNNDEFIAVFCNEIALIKGWDTKSQAIKDDLRARE